MSQFDFLKNVKWHDFHMRERVPFFVHFWTHGLIEKKVDIFGFDYTVQHVGHVDHRVLMDDQSFQRQRQELLERLREDPRFLCKVLERHYDEYERMKRVWKEIYAAENLSQKPVNTITAMLRKFLDSMDQYMAFVMLPLYVETDLEEQAQEALRTVFPKEKADQYYHTAVFPIREGLITEERRSLLQIAQWMKRGAEYQQLLAEHVEQFSWMANKFYTMEFSDTAYYLQRAQEIRDPDGELANMDVERDAHIRAYGVIIAAVRGEEKLLALLETIQASVYFRNFRGERLYQSSYYLRPLLQEIANRLRVELREVVYLTAFEIIALLEEGKIADPEKIAERKRGFALLTNVNTSEVLLGKLLEELRICITLDTNSVGTVEFYGQTAQPGKVQGIACVIRSKNELGKILDDCILITSSTTPDYVPFLSNVRGIVTEEGGILSHAAIISRELKIPCVIGAKGVTMTITDGQGIEIDAEKGIVRILSHHKP